MKGKDIRMGDMLKNERSLLDGISDKTLHCLARMFQDMGRGACDRCLYCKYAMECSEEFLKDRYLLSSELEHELSLKTGVVIDPYDDKKLNEELLKGSWMEEYPELLETFRTMSYERQQEKLTGHKLYCWLLEQRFKKEGKIS